MLGQRRRVALIMLAVALALSILPLGGGSTFASTRWTFGPEYLAHTEQYEVGNRWYAREVYWRAAYYDGVYQFAEFVRNVDYYRGPVLAYGSPEICDQKIEYVHPPHVHMVTTYRRPVYHYGSLSGYEALPDLTRYEDACQVSEGEPYAESATTIATAGGTMLRIVYMYPVYHANSRYGRFVVGQRQVTEIVPAAAPHSGAGHEGLQPIDKALREISSVEEFRDYLAVEESPWAADIREAHRLGLIVGKYDAEGRFYDPYGLITLGEMVNVLARNYGAASTLAGEAAVAYLQDLGVAVAGNLGAAMTLGQLQSLAQQLSSLAVQPKAELLVVRQVLDGSVAGSTGDGVTRDFAVAMYRPPAASTGGGLPQGSGALPSGYEPAVGPSGSTPDPQGTGDPAATPPTPLFVLTD